MKHFLLLLVALMSLPGFSQHWNWARQSINTSATQSARSIGHDQYGNVYVLGNGTSSGTFGNLSLPAGGFIIKYDSTGSLLWGKNVPTETQQMVVDRDGYIYLTGSFYSTLNSGTLTLTSNGSADFFLMKYSSVGIRLWERSYGGTSGDLCNAIALDNNGDIYLTGSFIDSIAFGQSMLQSYSPYSQFYLAKVSKAGNEDWAVTGDSSYYAAHHLFIDKNNTIFVEGHYEDTVSSWPCEGFFHDRYDVNGNRTHNKKMCLYNYGHTDMTVDDSLNIYHIDNSSQYGYVNLRKYDSSMNLKWSETIGEYYHDFLLTNGLTADTAGNIYLAGMVGGPNCFCDSVQVQPGSPWVKVQGFSDLALAKYNTHGKLLWLTTATGQSGESVSFLTLDKKGNIYLTGKFNYNFPGATQMTGHLTVANDVLTPDGTWEQLFVAKLSSQFISTTDFQLLQADNTSPQIFPSPSSGKFNIRNNGEIASVNIYNSLGERIFSGSTNGNQYQLDISSKPPGMYIIEVLFDDWVILRKVIKE
jgi:hypothetical protein